MTAERPIRTVAGMRILALSVSAAFALTIVAFVASRGWSRCRDVQRGAAAIDADAAPRHAEGHNAGRLFAAERLRAHRGRAGCPHWSERQPDSLDRCLP